MDDDFDFIPAPINSPSYVAIGGSEKEAGSVAGTSLVCPSCHHGFSTEQMVRYVEEKRRRGEFKKEYAEKLTRIRRINTCLYFWGMPTLFVIFLFLLSLQVKISDTRFSYVLLGVFLFSTIVLGLIEYWFSRIGKRYFQDWKKQHYPQ